MFLCEQQEEPWKEADTYTASPRYCLRDVTHHNPDIYQNWQCSIENRFSRHTLLKTYIRWSQKLPKSKHLFKIAELKYTLMH